MLTCPHAGHSLTQRALFAARPIRSSPISSVRDWAYRCPTLASTGNHRAKLDWISKNPLEKPTFTFSSGLAARAACQVLCTDIHTACAVQHRFVMFHADKWSSYGNAHHDSCMQDCQCKTHQCSCGRIVHHFGSVANRIRSSPTSHMHGKTRKTKVAPL